MFSIALVSTFKAIKSHLRDSYDKQNLTVSWLFHIKFIMVCFINFIWNYHSCNILYIHKKQEKISQLLKLWYLSHRRPAKAQASLHIRTVLPEPSLFAHTKCGSRRRVRPKIRLLATLDGWLHMCIWRMSLWRTKSTIISWDGSNDGC